MFNIWHDCEILKNPATKKGLNRKNIRNHILCFIFISFLYLPDILHMTLKGDIYYRYCCSGEQCGPFTYCVEMCFFLDLFCLSLTRRIMYNSESCYRILSVTLWIIWFIFIEFKKNINSNKICYFKDSIFKAIVKQTYAQTFDPIHPLYIGN